MKITRKGYFTITGPDGTLLLNDQGNTRQTTTRDEAYEYATEDSKTREFGDHTYTIHPPEYEMGLTDAGVTEAQNYEPAGDQPPTITSTPLPLFARSVAGNYDLTQHVSDDALSAVTYTLSNTLPNGLNLNANTGLLSYDGVAGDSVSSHNLTATDAVGFATSSSFNITISGVQQFTFTDQFNVPINSTVTSDEITVTGLIGLTTAIITVSIGEHQINGGSWTSSPGVVSNLDTVIVRHTSIGSNSTDTDQLVIIGGVSDTFTSTTETGVPSTALYESNFSAYSSECSLRGDAGYAHCDTVDNGDAFNWQFSSNFSNLTTQYIDTYPTGVYSVSENASGIPGKVIRQYQEDGSNNQGGFVQMVFGDTATGSEQEKELWIRHYERYPLGMTWNGGVKPHDLNYKKMMYFRAGPLAGPWPATLLPQFQNSNNDTFSVGTQGVGDKVDAGTSGSAWSDIHGGPGDGQWHMVEIYIKMDTNRADGIVRAYLEGNLVIDETGLDLSGGNASAQNGWSWFGMPSNQSSPAFGGLSWVEIDGVVMYNTPPPNIHSPSGYNWIGPL